MRTEQEIIKQLHTLQAVKPSDRLVNRINLLQKHLPDHSDRKNFSWFMLHTGIVVATVLLFVVGLGSGIVVAAAHSQPGGFLFPVKKAIIEAEMHFVVDPSKKQELQEQLMQKVEVPTPTQIFLQMQRSTPTPTSISEETEKNKNDVHLSSVDKKDVKGDSISPSAAPTPFVRGQQDEDGQYGNGNSKNSHQKNNGFFQFFLQHFEHREK